MLAIPEVISSCAKLRSPEAEPSGTPSSKICVPDAPSSTPLPPLSSNALRSSFHVVSNCAAVRTWPNSYKRANFSRIFRLRTNARAEARVSVAIDRKLQSLPRSLLDVLLQYGDPVEETSLVSRIVPISVTFSRRICSLAPSVSKTSSLNPPEAAGVAPSLRRLYNTVPRSPGALPRFLRRFVVPRGVNQTDIQECRTSPPPNASRRTSVRFLVVPRRPPTRSPVSSRCASLAFSPRLYSASFVCAG